MALTVIVEDGTNVAGANSYVDPAGSIAVNYFDSHLYASVWTAASVDDRAKAVIMATQYIDALIAWKGQKADSTQPLQWPRSWVWLDGGYLDDDEIPLDIQKAILETAQAFMVANRVADTGKAAGISQLGLGNGAIDITFNEPDPQRNLPIIPAQVMLILQRYGGAVQSSFRQIPVSR